MNPLQKLARVFYNSPTNTKEVDYAVEREELKFDMRITMLREFENHAVAEVNTRNRVMELASRNSRHCTRMPTHQINITELEVVHYQQKVDVDVSIDESEVEPTTLPAVISRELRASGVTNVKWSRLRDLPSHGDDFIRQLGRKVFEGFNIDENAEVYTICCFRNNPLLNEVMELNSVIGFLDKFAEKPYGETVGVHSFGNVIEDYEPLVKAYHSKDKCYLSVYEPDGHGFEGHYIYMFKLRN